MKKVRFAVGLAALVAIGALGSSIAVATPSISGVDGTVYGPGTIGSGSYTLVGTAPFAWNITGPGVVAPASGLGPTIGLASAGATGTYTVSATDSEPAAVTPAARTFVYDAAPPSAPALGPVPTPGNNLAPTLGWSAADPTPIQSSITSYQVQIDDGAIANRPGTRTTWDPPLRPGAHTARVRAVDAGGNIGAWSNTINFLIDIAPPQTPTPLAPAANTSTSDNTPAFDWTDSLDTGGAGRQDYQLRIEREAGGGQQTFTVASSDHLIGTALADGVYVWKVRSRDNAGNASVYTAERRLIIDSAAPGAPTLVQTAGALTRNTKPTFRWSGEAGTTYRYTLRDVAGTIIQQGNTGGATSVTLAALPGDGGYGFEVFQTDTAGNEGPGAVSNFTLDATPPGQPALTTLPKSPSVSPNPVFGWAPGEPGARFTWQVVNSTGRGIAGGTTTERNARPTNLPAGTHIFRLWQVDAAGNAGAAAEAIFTIVNPKPPTAKPTTKLVRPKTRNAKKVRPKAGIGISSRTATLKWRKTDKRTILYNVQLFRMNGRKLTKIHSAFPRGIRYKIPARLLKANNRYVWQVWEYLGAEDGYLPRPTAISYFDKKKTRIPSKILAPKGNHKAGKKLVVRWRAAPGSKYYEFQFFKGRKRVIKKVTNRTRYTLNAKLLRPSNAKYRVVVKRSIGKKKRFAKMVWGGKSFKVVKPKKK